MLIAEDALHKTEYILYLLRIFLMKSYAMISGSKSVKDASLLHSYITSMPKKTLIFIEESNWLNPDGVYSIP